MKINRGNNVEISSALVFSKENEIIILKDGMRIKVVTDGTDFDEVLVGEFTFVDNDTIDVDGMSIHIDYVEEVIVL